MQGSDSILRCVKQSLDNLDGAGRGHETEKEKLPAKAVNSKITPSSVYCPLLITAPVKDWPGASVGLDKVV